jgi:hypothetical protein
MTKTQKLTKHMARRFNAYLMHEGTFIGAPGCGVTKESWMALCVEFRDKGVALYPQVMRRAHLIDPTFTATVGNYDNPLA